MDFNKNCKPVFGSYVKSSNYATFKNRMKPQTYAFILLLPLENLQGFQNVFGVYTGIILKLGTIKEFTITDSVLISRNYWGKE